MVKCSIIEIRHAIVEVAIGWLIWLLGGRFGCKMEVADLCYGYLILIVVVGSQFRSLGVGLDTDCSCLRLHCCAFHPFFF